jgi:hypothetical protein
MRFTTSISILLCIILYFIPIASASAESIEHAIAAFKNGEASRSSLRQLMFSDSLGMLIQSSSVDIFEYLKKNPGRLDPSAEVYLAMRLLNCDILDNSQKLYLYGILYNNTRSYSSAQAKFILMEYYMSLPPELDDDKILKKMLEAGWKLDEPLFDNAKKSWKKLGSTQHQLTKPWVP